MAFEKYLQFYKAINIIKSGIAYAILTSGATTKLYTVNLTTGAATAVGDYPNKTRGFTLGLGF
jgi:hypothetical protein